VHDDPRPVVVFSGGGTGGHLYPALALADALQRRRPDVRPYFVGAERGVEARILPERGVEHLLVPVQGVQRGEGLGNWRAVPALARSLGRTWRLFRRLRPEAVVVTGGYAGGPAGIAAGAMGVPLVLQEQNAMPGITTRVLARWADQVHLAFPEAAGFLPARAFERTVESGNPVRTGRVPDRREARSALGVPDEPPVVLVTGGSQGSRALNQGVQAWVRSVMRGEGERRPYGLHLVWVTGPSHLDAVVARLEDALAGRKLPDWIHLHGYMNEMPMAMAASDLAVSRAGAMTTAELLCFGLPAILVPLPTAAADHQARNAEALEDAGAARLLPEAELTAETLGSALDELLEGAGTLAGMRAAALERARPNAADEIAAHIAKLLPEAAPSAVRPPREDA